MDSLTQIALGSCIAAACVPAAQRRRALVYGAALGTLPDLDVLIDLGDPIANFTYHRSFSHSLLVLGLLAPALWLLATRFDAVVRSAPRAWFAAFALALLTHPLLDAMTIYGTQLFWPLDPTPVGIGSIFIIDPLYTLPLLLALTLVAWRPLAVSGKRTLVLALCVSSAYLGWSVLAQQFVLTRAHATLAAQNMPQQQVLALPSPFNTLLWRVLVREDNGYREAYFSLLADKEPGPWREFASADQWRGNLEELWSYQRLAWFTHGYYAIRDDDGRLVVVDLRMGSEPAYVFAFELARHRGGEIEPVSSNQLTAMRPVGSALRWVYRRIQQPGHTLLPPDQVLLQRE